MSRALRSRRRFTSTTTSLASTSFRCSRFRRAWTRRGLKLPTPQARRCFPWTFRWTTTRSHAPRRLRSTRPGHSRCRTANRSCWPGFSTTRMPVTQRSRTPSRTSATRKWASLQVQVAPTRSHLFFVFFPAERTFCRLPMASHQPHSTTSWETKRGLSNIPAAQR
jgi:hypothetical protein